MASDTKLAIGLATLFRECLAATPTGVVPSVSLIVPYCENQLTAADPGLATNFILIESLQRFYQYYGDELQVNRYIMLVFSGAHDFHYRSNARPAVATI